MDKKDSLHPPVSYRSISRTGAISRETSPSSVSSSTPGSYSANRLYPDSYTRGTSRERTESTSPSSTIPKYTGRSSTTKEIIPLSRTGRNESKEDLSSRYRSSSSKATSREDLSSGPQKYITSRFLPKNTVEKSYTAYTRPSAVRVSEACRKNRELLNVITAQHEQEKLSRPVSRCSSTTPEDTSKSTSTEPATSSSVRKSEQEMESLSVVTRSTSPMQLNPVNVSRTRRIDVAKTVEKVITRPKKKAECVDKEVQSDRMDDTARYSRFASSSSRTAATPWSSILDMKFSSPGDNQKTAKIEQSKEDISSQSEKTDSTSKTQSNKTSKEGSASPRNMSRSNSIKNLSRSFSKLDMKGKDSRSPTPTSQLNDKCKQKVSSAKSSDKKQLPPQIPKSENNSKSNSGPAPNKDFRKSVLNMNYEGKPKKTTKRSNSVSSADSGSEAADTTDISENLTSCPSYHKSNSSSSKLPQRVSAENTRRSCTRSPSVETNSSSSSPASGSEDDQSKKSKQKKRPTAFSPKASADELSSEKCPKPPLSPRVRNDSQRSEAEAKSFLMRALAPVTSLFKVRHIDSSDKVNWMDSSTEHTPDSPEHSKLIVEEEKPQKKAIKRIESGEKPWWGEEDKQKLSPEEKIIKKTLRHTDSGEKPWWMDENAEVPSGIEQYTSESQDENSGFAYKVRHNDSDNKEWWLSSSDNANDKSASENAIQPESLQQYRLRHIDSGERAWWFSSTENLAENTNQQEQQQTTQGDNKSIYRIRHQQSGERAWWMNPQENEKNSDDESDNDLIPLGDRASPEGLETPRDEEMQGRRSPYDNVPGSHGKPKRPTHIPLFISNHTNIDDILGGTTQLLSPLMDTIFSYRKGLEEYEEIDPSQVKIHEGIAQRPVIETGRK